MKLLTKIVLNIQEEGWSPVFVDCIIIAQVPKLNVYIAEMKRNLSKTIGCDVNIKVKSGEHIPPVGDAACIVCHAAATITPLSKGGRGDCACV